MRPKVGLPGQADRVLKRARCGSVVPQTFTARLAEAQAKPAAAYTAPRATAERIGKRLSHVMRLASASIYRKASLTDADAEERGLADAQTSFTLKALGPGQLRWLVQEIVLNDEIGVMTLLGETQCLVERLFGAVGQGLLPVDEQCDRFDFGLELAAAGGWTGVLRSVDDPAHSQWWFTWQNNMRNAALIAAEAAEEAGPAPTKAQDALSTLSGATGSSDGSAGSSSPQLRGKSVGRMPKSLARFDSSRSILSSDGKDGGAAPSDQPAPLAKLLPGKVYSLVPAWQEYTTEHGANALSSPGLLFTTFTAYFAPDLAEALFPARPGTVAACSCNRTCPAAALAWLLGGCHVDGWASPALSPFHCVVSLWRGACACCAPSRCNVSCGNPALALRPRYSRPGEGGGEAARIALLQAAVAAKLPATPSASFLATHNGLNAPHSEAGEQDKDEKQDASGLSTLTELTEEGDADDTAALPLGPLPTDAPAVQLQPPPGATLARWAGLWCFLMFTIATLAFALTQYPAQLDAIPADVYLTRTDRRAQAANQTTPDAQLGPGAGLQQPHSPLQAYLTSLTGIATLIRSCIVMFGVVLSLDAPMVLVSSAYSHPRLPLRLACFGHITKALLATALVVVLPWLALTNDAVGDALPDAMGGLILILPFVLPGVGQALRTVLYALSPWCSVAGVGSPSCWRQGRLCLSGQGAMHSGMFCHSSPCLCCACGCFPGGDEDTAACCCGPCLGCAQGSPSSARRVRVQSFSAKKSGQRVNKAEALQSSRPRTSLKGTRTQVGSATAVTWALDAHLVTPSPTQGVEMAPHSRKSRSSQMSDVPMRRDGQGPDRAASRASRAVANPLHAARGGAPGLRGGLKGGGRSGSPRRRRSSVSEPPHMRHGATRTSTVVAHGSPLPSSSGDGDRKETPAAAPTNTQSRRARFAAAASSAPAEHSDTAKRGSQSGQMLRTAMSKSRRFLFGATVDEEAKAYAKRERRDKAHMTAVSMRHLPLGGGKRASIRMTESIAAIKGVLTEFGLHALNAVATHERLVARRLVVCLLLMVGIACHAVASIYLPQLAVREKNTPQAQIGLFCVYKAVCLALFHLLITVLPWYARTGMAGPPRSSTASILGTTAGACLRCCSAVACFEEQEGGVTRPRAESAPGVRRRVQPGALSSSPAQVCARRTCGGICFGCAPRSIPAWNIDAQWLGVLLWPVNFRAFYGSSGRLEALSSLVPDPWFNTAVITYTSFLLHLLETLGFLSMTPDIASNGTFAAVLIIELLSLGVVHFSWLQVSWRDVFIYGHSWYGLVLKAQDDQYMRDPSDEGHDTCSFVGPFLRRIAMVLAMTPRMADLELWTVLADVSAEVDTDALGAMNAWVQHQGAAATRLAVGVPASAPQHATAVSAGDDSVQVRVPYVPPLPSRRQQMFCCGCCACPRAVQQTCGRPAYATEAEATAAEHDALVKSVGEADVISAMWRAAVSGAARGGRLAAARCVQMLAAGDGTELNLAELFDGDPPKVGGGTLQRDRSCTSSSLSEGWVVDEHGKAGLGLWSPRAGTMQTPTRALRLSQEEGVLPIDPADHAQTLPEQAPAAASQPAADRRTRARTASQRKLDSPSEGDEAVNSDSSPDSPSDSKESVSISNPLAVATPSETADEVPESTVVNPLAAASTTSSGGLEGSVDGPAPAGDSKETPPTDAAAATADSHSSAPQPGDGMQLNPMAAALRKAGKGSAPGDAGATAAPPSAGETPAAPCEDEGLGKHHDDTKRMRGMKLFARAASSRGRGRGRRRRASLAVTSAQNGATSASTPRLVLGGGEGGPRRSFDGGQADAAFLKQVDAMRRTERSKRDSSALLSTPMGRGMDLVGHEERRAAPAPTRTRPQGRQALRQQQAPPKQQAPPQQQAPRQRRASVLMRAAVAHKRSAPPLSGGPPDEAPPPEAAPTPGSASKPSNKSHKYRLSALAPPPQPRDGCEPGAGPSTPHSLMVGAALARVPEGFDSDSSDSSASPNSDTRGKASAPTVEDEGGKPRASPPPPPSRGGGAAHMAALAARHGRAPPAAPSRTGAHTAQQGVVARAASPGGASRAPPHMRSSSADRFSRVRAGSAAARASYMAPVSAIMPSPHSGARRSKGRTSILPTSRGKRQSVRPSLRGAAGVGGRTPKREEDAGSPSERELVTIRVAPPPDATAGAAAARDRRRVSMHEAPPHDAQGSVDAALQSAVDAQGQHFHFSRFLSSMGAEQRHSLILQAWALAQAQQTLLGCLAITLVPTVFIVTLGLMLLSDNKHVFSFRAAELSQVENGFWYCGISLAAYCIVALIFASRLHSRFNLQISGQVSALLSARHLIIITWTFLFLFAVHYLVQRSPASILPWAERTAS